MRRMLSLKSERKSSTPSWLRSNLKSRQLKWLLENIKSESLSEIRSLRAPPTVIRDILEGVLSLMGIFDTSWVSMKKVAYFYLFYRALFLGEGMQLLFRLGYAACISKV